MAAQPKRKITRAMQGKRRRGNTPKLRKDATYSSVQTYKRGFFDKFMSLVTGKPVAAPAEANKDKSVKSAKAAEGTTAQTAARQKPATQVASVKKVTRTQHKGG